MPFVAEIVIIGLGPSNEAIVNTFHYATDTELNNDQADGVLTAFEALIETDFLACLSPDWKGYLTRIKNITGLTPTAVEHDISDWQGSRTGTSLPMQVCAVVQRHTGAGGRKSRGRVFLSPVIEGDFDVNGLFVGDNTAFNVFAEDMTSLIEGVESPTATPVLFHKADNTSDTVVGGKLSVIAGTRRSRRVRSPN